ncbi:MAG: 1,4-dihydroxy-2-naphthoate polyprenyltransferase [Anaerolineae bacterium]|nr:1,4-dihydroxy-2-naphthoate polyprenyltransferase [Anaerolineae bacterium]
MTPDTQHLPTPDKRKAWLSAMRLRTLPLALACIMLGAFLAAADDKLDGVVVVLCVLTAVLLQILSNLANDYGDSLHGADHSERLGPARAVQSGAITPQAMKRAMGLFAGLSAVSGLALVVVAFGLAALPLVLLFLALGAASLWAAVNYTAGKRPYGYAGLGDLFVLLFFGWVGAIGTYFLQTQTFSWALLLPASSAGLLAVAVLNVNNIRDIVSDKQAGKRSIPVRLGPERARIYHWCLLMMAFVLAGIYAWFTYQSLWQFLFVLAAPLLVRHGTAVQRTHDPLRLNPLLKQMVFTALIFDFLLGLGQVMG